jgi:tetratricopeptide (TPR) repeat protein
VFNMTTSQQSARERALARLHAGQTALAEGRLERAVDALVEAESIFRQIDDREHLADSRMALAETQRQHGAIDQSANSYAQAIDLYREANLPAREGSASLALGHIDRQRGRIDSAWQHYYLALRLFEKGKNASGQASASLALGHVERLRGRDEKAAEYYTAARKFATKAHDTLAEADAARGQGDMLTSQSRYDKAREAYLRARELYQQMRDQFGEVDTYIGEGRLALETANLDAAEDHFGEAIALAEPIEYPLGVADGILGIGEVALHRNRLDQALANGMRAEEDYRGAGSALGQAEANRLLGEVNLLRGQLSQSVAVFERAMRALTTLKAQLPYARATLGVAEAYRRKGTPRKAEDLFTEARDLARETGHPIMEARAVLGLGQIARHRGLSAIALPLLEESARRLEAAHRSVLASLAMDERARLALTQGKLDDASQLAAQALTLARQTDTTTGELGPEAAACCAAGMAALLRGQVTEARAFGAEAVVHAQKESDEIWRAEAALLMGEVELEDDNLSAAVASFNRAQGLAHDAEAQVVEGLAQVGLARVLLRRELYAEAANGHQEMLFRFRVADEPEAQALVHLGLGEARRQLGDTEAAMQAFSEALRLYQDCDNPLGQSDACAGLANVLVEQGNPEARERFGQALALAEQVGDAIADEQVRAGFFDARAALYADALVEAAQAQDAAQLEALVERYRGRAAKNGRLALAQRLQEFEHVIPVRSDDLTPEEAAHNKAVARALADARRALKR